MKNKLPYFFLITLLLSRVLFAADDVNETTAQSLLKHPPPTGFVRFTNKAFAFDIPKAWHSIPGNHLDTFRREFENQSREQFREFYGRAGGYDWGVDAVTGYSSPDETVTFIALVLKVPPEPKGAIQAAWERSQAVIEYGKQSGRLRKVYRLEKTELSCLPALKSDFEMGNGDRMVSVAIEASPGAIVQMSFLCKPGAYGKYEADIDQVMKRFIVLQKVTGQLKGDDKK